MKNYFNTQDRTRHIIILGMQEILNELANSTAISPEERLKLLKADKYVKEFNASILDRFGQAYINKIKSTMACNDLRLVGKYSACNECVSHIVAEDLKRVLADLRMYNCLDCEKCDFKNCAVYAVHITADTECEDTDGCPFKM